MNYNKYGGSMENKTLKNLIKEATLGVADSMFLLGRHFYKGDGVKQDYYRAYYWFKKASDERHYEAMYYAGVCLKNGFGCDVNHELSLTYFKEAADGGVAMAQYILLSF